RRRPALGRAVAGALAPPRATARAPRVATAPAPARARRGAADLRRRGFERVGVRPRTPLGDVDVTARLRGTRLDEGFAAIAVDVKRRRMGTVCRSYGAGCCTARVEVASGRFEREPTRRYARSEDRPVIPT